MLQFAEKLKNTLDIAKFMHTHANDPNTNLSFSSEVTIEHLDGSKFDLRCCSWDECEDKIYIWTEHCGYLHFFKDDLRKMESAIYSWNDEKYILAEHSIMNFNWNL